MQEVDWDASECMKSTDTSQCKKLIETPVNARNQLRRQRMQEIDWDTSECKKSIETPVNAKKSKKRTLLYQVKAVFDRKFLLLQDSHVLFL